MSLPSSFYLTFFLLVWLLSYLLFSWCWKNACPGSSTAAALFSPTEVCFFVVLATFRPPAIGRAAYHYQITNRVSFSPFSISQQIFFDAMLSNRLPQVFVLLYFVLILAAASHYRTTPSEQVYQAVRKIFILILRNTSLVLFGEKILHLLTHTPTHAEYLIFPCCLTMVLFGSWRVVFFFTLHRVSPLPNSKENSSRALGLAMIIVILLRYPYCANTAAVSAHPAQRSVGALLGEQFPAVYCQTKKLHFRWWCGRQIKKRF